MKISFVVTVDRPCGASDAAIRAFIKEAVICNVGCKDPLDPMFDLDQSSVEVSRYHKPKAA